MERSDFSVSGLKTFQGNEGLGYNATIRYKGKKVAFVIDDASGGGPEIQWEATGPHFLRREPTPLEKEIEEFAAGLPPKVLEGSTLTYDVEIFFEDLVNEHLEEQELKKKCRRKILYKDAEGRIFEVSTPPPVTPAIRARVKEWGGVEIINDRYIKPARARKTG
jgi:hypothetical protein